MTKRKAPGSKLGYLLFFSVGMGLMIFLRWFGLSLQSAPTSGPPAWSENKSGPWGELELTPLVLERPDAMFDTNNVPAPPLNWFFPRYSREQLAALIASCELTSSQKASLLDTNKWQPERGGWTIRPDLEVAGNLAPAAREKLYAVLGQSHDNAGQAFPFVYRRDGFEEWFSGCELPPEKIALVRKLAYPKKELLCFADVQLFELLSSSNETRCLIKTLCRVPTLAMKIKIKPETDLEALLAYWGGCCRGKEMKPLLKSMARVPGGASINISFFLPSVPRLRLYTYPDPATPAREDCFWSSFNFFNDEADERFLNPEYADQFLQSQFEEVKGERRFGDLMLLLGPGERAIHMCVYLAADVVYTKNGGHIYQPWVLMKLSDMMIQYPSDQPLTWRTFRKKDGFKPSLSARNIESPSGLASKQGLNGGWEFATLSFPGRH